MLLYSESNVIAVQSQWYSISKVLNLKWKYCKRYNPLNINEFCKEWTNSFVAQILYKKIGLERGLE